MFTDAQQLKFHLLASGMGVSDRASDRLSELNGHRPLTPADYASTTGLIIRLEDDVWVNAPTRRHNPNFVGDSPFVLDLDADSFLVRGDRLESHAQVWQPPRYHGEQGSFGRPLNHFVFTHGDRVRLSPIQGCAMVCKFCNIPYEDRYATKPQHALLEAVQVALTDELQPAHHLLISGGTPHERDFGFLREFYISVLDRFPRLEIDVMMVPIDGLLDVRQLADHGVHELSINLEVFNEDVAASMMRQKHGQGRKSYLDFIEQAAEHLGPGRVRSMLMVGLEPKDDTLAGVRAIVDRGGVPVLSPFRPDPGTPLSAMTPPDAAFLADVFLRASDMAGPLGPPCAPCTHNTLTLVQAGVDYEHPVPVLLGANCAPSAASR